MKVGDYVRTKREIIKISKIYERTDGNTVFDDEKGCQWYFTEIKKSSPNILDLIEENDFITIEYYSLRYDERVTRIFEVDYKDEKFTTLKNAYCDFMLKNNEFNDSDKALEPIIKSIVTKEQFESMEYKIGE